MELRKSVRERLAIAVAMIAFGPAVYAGTLKVTIEDENGRAVPARVYLNDSEGKAILPSEQIVYDKTRPDGMSEKHFVPAAGSFRVTLSGGKYQLTVERGKEYLPEARTVEVPASGKLIQNIRLRRWIDMKARGYYAGDMHVHRGLAQLSTLMAAEDLSVAVPMTRWKTLQQEHADPDLEKFLKNADANGFFKTGEGRFFPVLNEELEPRSSAILASRLNRTAVPLKYPLPSFGVNVIRAGGVSDSEKATSLELPALAALNAVETVGLANNHLWRSGSYADAWGAWPDRMMAAYPKSCEGFVQAGFEMYAALLNAGFPLKLSAGSASGVHPVPPGWSRIYVRTGEPLTPDAWFRGLRAGRSFVTTGPMLLLTVNGKEPGDEVRGGHFPLKLDAAVEMLSIKPVTSVEVVLNGEVHPVALTPDPKLAHGYRGSVSLQATMSSWMAARWHEARGNTCDAAHTSPIYFWNGSAPVPLRRGELTVLEQRVQQLIDQVRTGGGVPGGIVADSDQLRSETINAFEKALDVYRVKLRQAEHE